MNQDDVFRAMTDLARMFEGKNISEERVAIFVERLDDLDPNLVVPAIVRISNTSKFFPSLAEIREATVAQQPLDGLAEMAWAEVQHQALTVGYNPGRTLRAGIWYDAPKPQFTSPVTEQSVKSIGWRELCLTANPEEKIFLRNQFIKTWTAYASRTLKQAQNGDVLDMMPSPAQAALRG